MEKFRRPEATTLGTRLLDLTGRRSEAQQNSAQARQQRKRRYDKTHRDGTFQVGQFAWLQRQEPITNGTTKMAPTFKGLYRITEQRTPVTYVVRRVAAHATSTSSRNEKVVHSSQLKLFCPPYMDPALFPLERSIPVTSQPGGTSDKEAIVETVVSPTSHIPSGEEKPPSTSSSVRGHIQQPRWIDDHEE
ncbi:hypothetical protein ISCGN_012163 [Ixodes scapularis]